ncbi:MAG: heavy-metal-associated domain-containing protein [Alsobacter sp.]|nr:heavy metal-associated domain-containing protein [Burkholderiales bacterium]
MTTSTTGKPDVATFLVADMSCNHCVSAIRSALSERLPGADVAIDLGTKTVRVAGDSATAEAAIRQAGYEPVPQAGR